jgi:hypothetical protein
VAVGPLAERADTRDPGSDDRLFPLEFQRRVVRDRLGIDVDAVPGGHLVSLSRPAELTERLLAHGSEALTAR